MPDEPVYIVSDGAKLSRVLQNLISNTLKYSLLGSRVFIDLEVQGKEALVTIKNTANYEMDFDEEEILERFVRGDRSRSTEGSGLGLSIAKSLPRHAEGGSLSRSTETNSRWSCVSSWPVEPALLLGTSSCEAAVILLLIILQASSSERGRTADG